MNGRTPEHLCGQIEYRNAIHYAADSGLIDYRVVVLLLAVADKIYANKDGPYVTPDGKGSMIFSWKEIASSVGLPERMYFRQVKIAEDLGWLERRKVASSREKLLFVPKIPDNILVKMPHLAKAIEAQKLQRAMLDGGNGVPPPEDEAVSDEQHGADIYMDSEGVQRIYDPGLYRAARPFASDDEELLKAWQENRAEGDRRRQMGVQDCEDGEDVVWPDVSRYSGKNKTPMYKQFAAEDEKKQWEKDVKAEMLHRISYYDYENIIRGMQLLGIVGGVALLCCDKFAFKLYKDNNDLKKELQRLYAMLGIVGVDVRYAWLDAG